jgi:hypothetical protein
MILQRACVVVVVVTKTLKSKVNKLLVAVATIQYSLFQAKDKKTTKPSSCKFYRKSDP